MSTWISAGLEPSSVAALTSASSCRSSMELHTLCVAPGYQSRGIGSAIVRGARDARAAGRTVVLSVLKANERTRTFYERLGFVIVNESTYHHRMRFKEPAADE